ncbi:agmatinase [Blochmannia endosymbiont of Colobopsis nipponica]|uniref:agmatinase n=1 Tax=Blochmannia endosymbiont of Colobopsis nipponica TaxID=2681987 RepID=UPI00177AFCA2|nr:agmatinase [Blochmannia endosymbiont of Colobopsis nipponica]QOI11175.1 agmatinase [Blochmannia endosymbiont of Colobopsis nipponica]
MKILSYKYDESLISNTFSFLRLPLDFNPYKLDCDWVITGVPCDITTSGRSGSKLAPSAIRQISSNLAWESCRWPWNFDIRQLLKIVDCGDLVFEIGNIEDLTDKLQIHAQQLLFSGKRMLSFGGDHYITLPLLRAHAQFFGTVSLLHFDAHTDAYICGNKYDHGTIFFHALHENLIDPDHSIQIGIRTTSNYSNKFIVLDMKQIYEHGIDYIVNYVGALLGSRPVYLTFDIDCLDPSVAPGTGTPVIGGLTSYSVLELLRGLRYLNIVGMDLVEVSPAYDYAQITALTAATIALEMLYIQASRSKMFRNF